MLVVHVFLKDSSFFYIYGLFLSMSRPVSFSVQHPCTSINTYREYQALLINWATQAVIRITSGYWSVWRVNTHAELWSRGMLGECCNADYSSVLRCHLSESWELVCAAIVRDWIKGFGASRKAFHSSIGKSLQGSMCHYIFTLEYRGISSINLTQYIYNEIGVSVCVCALKSVTLKSVSERKDC